MSHFMRPFDSSDAEHYPGCEEFEDGSPPTIRPEVVNVEMNGQLFLCDLTHDANGVYLHPLNRDETTSAYWQLNSHNVPEGTRFTHTQLLASGWDFLGEA